MRLRRLRQPSTGRYAQRNILTFALFCFHLSKVAVQLNGFKITFNYKLIACSHIPINSGRRKLSLIITNKQLVNNRVSSEGYCCLVKIKVPKCRPNIVIDRGSYRKCVLNITRVPNLSTVFIIYLFFRSEKYLGSLSSYVRALFKIHKEQYFECTSRSTHC